MRDTKGGKQFRTSKIVSCEWKTILRGKKKCEKPAGKCFKKKCVSNVNLSRKQCVRVSSFLCGGEKVKKGGTISGQTFSFHC